MSSRPSHAIPVVNDILIEKQRRLFYFYDYNKNGIWDLGDLELIKGKLTKEISHLSPQKQVDVTDMMTGVWKVLTNKPSKTLTWDEFLENYTSVVGKDLEKYRAMVITAMSRIFDCMDTNQDGRLDYDEYRAYRSLEGFFQEADIRKVFNVIDRNKDNYISKDEFISAYLTYGLDRTFGADDLPLYG